ncbi:DUF695 domain-containing protein [Flavobacterium pectinovorum]|uniref:DUF695 domain-containing protein n=1 Tax=Flavobacterium pectinovorum TaxID=29533 RepID=A0A502EDI1_9FLAO|nr:DUF695 domain-containing protein [Flavobacterium pectinovorum]TPG35497.1 DUF695 domain-containing protein [Flavobacterium pectinovorum]
MKSKIRKIFILLFVTITTASFCQNKTIEKMEWLTTRTEYEGLPLYLRIPNYKNIWEYKSKYPVLISITLEFESIKDNGLPTSDYNKSLMDFDLEVINIFEGENCGIIFLIETYGGERNYWFYGEDSKTISNLFNELKSKYSDKKIKLDYQNNADWSFINDYPVQLYKNQ